MFFECLKWFYFNTNFMNECYISSIMLLPANRLNYYYRSIFTGKTSVERIGPHSKEIISIIIGSLLGDGHLEKRKQGVGTRIKFSQSSANVEYLMWFYQYLSSRGYCSKKKPLLKKRIREGGQVFYHYRINSYTFTSFNWIRNIFYKENGGLKKVIPVEIKEYLTPFALAIWFMDDGSKLGKGAKIATNGYELSELKSIIIILKDKYNLEATYHKGAINKGHTIYIPSKSMKLFSSIVKPYILPSMLYKIQK